MAKSAPRKNGPKRPLGSDLLFLPLGGAGEIGMNLNLFGLSGKWMMVDLGITFGDDTSPGIDVIMPDPAFIVDRRDDLVGLVLTHAHEDHIGAVPYLWRRLQCPMYATPFTASVLRRKLTEAGLGETAKITEVPLQGRFNVGPFDVELLTLTHSIPEPNALVIRTPQGVILHTGDWKFDPTPLVGPPPDEAALRRLGEEGVLALIGDSTNVFRDGEAGSESAVRDSLIDLVDGMKNRVAIACFASNVARLGTVAAVAAAHGRRAALIGRSLWRMYDAARENGYLTDIDPFLSEQDAALLPRDKVLLAVTGSQGEPRAALARIAARGHPHVVLEEGDTVIFSSRIIPGNERSIGRLQDSLIRQGVDIVTEKDDFVHVSGHPARDELIRMYQWVRPRIAVPVHGEMRHLMEHAKLAKECQVPETVVAGNGEMVRLAPDPAEIVDQVVSGRLALDGSALVPMGSTVIRERRKILYEGAVVASLVMDDRGTLLADPQLTLYGLADEDEEDDRYDELYDVTVEAIEAAVEGLKAAKKRDDYAVYEVSRRAIRQVMKTLRGKKPVTDVHVTRVD